MSHFQANLEKRARIINNFRTQFVQVLENSLNKEVQTPDAMNLSMQGQIDLNMF